MYIVRSETSPVRWKFGFTKAMPPHQWIPGQKPNETQIRELLTLLKKASSAELGMGGILTDLESGNSTLLLAESGRQAWLGGCFRKGHWNWSEDPIFPCDIGLTLKWIAVFSIPKKTVDGCPVNMVICPSFPRWKRLCSHGNFCRADPHRDGVWCVYGCPCTFKRNVNQSDCSISNLYNIL